MFQQSHAALYLGLLVTLVSQVYATTNVQSFPAANCDAGTSTFLYFSEDAAQVDTECKTPPEGTIAIWVEAIAADAGCTSMFFHCQTY